MIDTARLPHGIDLAFERHGDGDAPVVMPVLGITDNLTDWPPGLTDPLVAAGFHVVRHELRDSGHSTGFDAAGPADLPGAFEALAAGRLPDAPYTMHDVAGDMLALMDHLGIERAALVCYSYGAAVAQIAALAAPGRVSAVVCLQGSNYDPSLPPRTVAVNEAMAAATREYPSHRERVATMTALRLATNGSRHAMGEAEARACAEASVARAYRPHGTARRVLSRLATPPFFEDSARIACPTLVLHADEDPIFPPAHGEAIARRIPGARLEELEGAGHNHPASLQPELAARLVEFLGARARGRPVRSTHET